MRFASCTLTNIFTLTASTFIVFQDGNAAKSSQKLRHPGTQPRQTHASQGRGSSGVGDARLPKAVGEQRPRKVGAGPRQSKGQTPPISARVPTAPLQLRWFPGNQVLVGAYLAMHCSIYLSILASGSIHTPKILLCVGLPLVELRVQSFADLVCDARQDFFYHVLLALDSYTFNSHLKTELVAEIARLYYHQTTSKTRGVSVVHHKEGASGASDDSNSTAGERVRGFTGTMVKLKVRHGVPCVHLVQNS